MSIANLDAFVIIDMQPLFASAKCDITAGNIIKLSREAIEHSVPIVLVEYEHYGKTRSDILDVIGGYKNFRKVTKNVDNDAYHIMATLQDFYQGLSPKFTKIAACGVNTGACVKSTVEGLNGFGCDVTVYKKACNQPQDWGYVPEQVFEYFQKNGVNVI